MRLTREVRQQLLEQNEDFELKIPGRSMKNSSETRWYRISGGQLIIRAKGKTSWADSHYDNEYTATDEQAHRFLRDYLDYLNTDGLE